MVKHLYCPGQQGLVWELDKGRLTDLRGDMETKKDLITATIRQLRGVAGKITRAEEMPILVEGGLLITTREAHTIEAVGRLPQMSVTDVANAFGITKSAASQMVSKLCSKGFLNKQQAPHSNKECQLTLTPVGKKAFEAHERFHGQDREALVERLSAFSLSQIATISVLLEAIGDVMDKRLSYGRRTACSSHDENS
jgi:DNA-binding MarR family transcriptional regulator